MPKTVDDLVISNIALGHLNEDPLDSLEDITDKKVRTLNRIFPFCRDNVLRAKNWGFAKVKELLVELDDQEIPGWSYVYAIPAKCLCVRKVFLDTGDPDPKPIEHEKVFIPELNQEVIACNSEEAYIEFTYQVTDVSKFDVSAAMALSFLVATHAAIPLTGDQDKMKTLLSIYLSMVSDAARINDGESNVKQKQTSSFEDSR